MIKPNRILGGTVFSIGIALAGVLQVHAQSIVASGTVSGVQGSPGVYDYTLTLSDDPSSTSSIGSLWYAWTPGFFYLPSTPTAGTSPTGWSQTVVGASIQFYDSSSLYNINPGGQLTFTYSASFSPAQLAAAANSGLSIAYAGAVDASSPATEFTLVQVVPEPGVASLALVGLGGFLFVARKTVIGRQGLR